MHHAPRSNLEGALSARLASLLVAHGLSREASAPRPSRDLVKKNLTPNSTATEFPGNAARLKRPIRRQILGLIRTRYSSPTTTIPTHIRLPSPSNSPSHPLHLPLLPPGSDRPTNGAATQRAGGIGAVRTQICTGCFKSTQCSLSLQSGGLARANPLLVSVSLPTTTLQPHVSCAIAAPPPLFFLCTPRTQQPPSLSAATAPPSAPVVIDVETEPRNRDSAHFLLACSPRTPFLPPGSCLGWLRDPTLTTTPPPSPPTPSSVSIVGRRRFRPPPYPHPYPYLPAAAALRTGGTSRPTTATRCCRQRRHFRLPTPLYPWGHGRAAQSPFTGVNSPSCAHMNLSKRSFHIPTLHFFCTL
ncbi:hypothetical protein C8R43DRAFT_1134309 [Mycena crocata]|nr:hypothetical protein C8R43DRAFT_1134309 [Mycena crocata]